MVLEFSNNLVLLKRTFNIKICNFHIWITSTFNTNTSVNFISVHLIFGKKNLGCSLNINKDSLAWMASCLIWLLLGVSDFNKWSMVCNFCYSLHTWVNYMTNRRKENSKQRNSGSRQRRRRQQRPRHPQWWRWMRTQTCKTWRSIGNGRFNRTWRSASTFESFVSRRANY